MKKEEVPFDAIGIIPSAGAACRLRPSRYPKELLPVLYVSDDSGHCVVPTPVITLALRSLVNAGISRCIVPISDQKTELLRYLGDGSDFDLQIAFIHQPIPTGLTAAVNLALPWAQNSYCCLLLPDTIVAPPHALNRVIELARYGEVDLALGVFPTKTPEQLGPVRFDTQGRILEVLDKPARTDLYNSWFIAVWSPAFSRFLHQNLNPMPDYDLPLGSLFNLAIQKGMSARAVWFADGSATDIGSFPGLLHMVQQSIQHTQELVQIGI